MTTDPPGVRPPWVSADLFPFESRFENIDGSVVHLVDEGRGPVLLMLHGNPGWSFLYRKLIQALSGSFRCVTLDYPGFGLSTAAAGYRYTAAEHVTVVERVVERLDLQNIVLMVHDWGGPIGFAAASRAPHRYAGFVIGNSWAWPIGSNQRLAMFSQLMGGPVGRLLIRDANVFITPFVRSGHTRHKPTKADMVHWRAPFPDRASREPICVFPRELTAASHVLHEAERSLAAFRDRPALITWGDRDRAFTKEDKRRFEASFPDHTTADLVGVSHYIQDDADDLIVPAILDWRTTSL